MFGIYGDKLDDQISWVAGVLYLGNITFRPLGEDGSDFDDVGREAAEKVAKFLGVDLAALRRCIIEETIAEDTKPSSVDERR